MVAGRAALFGGDKLSVSSHIGVAGAALDFLFHEMTFVREVESEDLSADFIDSRMAVGAFRGNDIGFYGYGLWSIRRSGKFQGFHDFIVSCKKKFLGVFDVVNAFASFDDIDVEGGLVEEALSLLTVGLTAKLLVVIARCLFSCSGFTG